MYRKIGIHTTKGFVLCVIIADSSETKSSKEQTVFHSITQSPEMLAPNFVYFAMSDEYGRDYWGSSLLDGKFWKTRDEAIAATLEKLKEVYDEQV